MGAGEITRIDSGGNGGAAAPFTIKGGWFCPSVTIAPGETCELRFFFTPHTAGSYSGLIVMDTDDPTSLYSFSWVGQGTAAAAPAPPTPPSGGPPPPPPPPSGGPPPPPPPPPTPTGGGGRGA